MAMQPMNPTFGAPGGPAWGSQWGGAGFGAAPQAWGYGPQPGFGPGFGWGYGFQPVYGYTYPAISPIDIAMLYGGLGGLRRHGGTYSQQFLTTGLPTDEEVTEMVYDQLDTDPFVPYDADINVDVDAGTVTLTGSVPSKAAKHAAGDDAWWVPGVDDVKNELTVTDRHRHRARTHARRQAQGQTREQPSR